MEGARDGSSESTPTFEVQIKGALENTIEFHLKMRLVMYLLVQKTAQNDSIKGELDVTLRRTKNYRIM